VDCEVDFTGYFAILSEIPIRRERTCSVRRALQMA